MTREGEKNLEQIINWHEFPYKSKELPAISDGDLLHNLKWLRGEIQKIIAVRDTSETENDKNSVQDYLIELYSYLNLLSEEFNRRKLDFPEK